MKSDEFDSIIFDCDGVLIDVTESYDTTINKTISYVLKEVANITVDTPLTNELLLSFKSTGGFNDEIDITYAGILCFIAAEKLNKNPTELIFDVINNADDSGIAYVENFLKKIDVDVSDVEARLNYPSIGKNDLIHSTFDQLFFGPELYGKVFQKKSKFSEKGFIENDNVIVTSELIEALKKKFNDKIAIVTGRGFNAISSSLKGILNKFNVENSVFLEDESRDLAKPNPQSLIRSMKGLNSKNCLYVGDSMEDMILAQKATELGFQVSFCGIYGSGKLPEMKKNMFIKKNASFILESINFLPKALNLV
ncbi:HAD-hyrolase-like domain containing protein [Marine Group I thaumarchaeote SCGC AAA799-O18]|jgi:HAD superfamily hydrolase (TIGR01549 family)|nr:HAD-hyrolase-like domain containing protein [Marine Group I thaumarchaeote SCGC AAA799-O18]